MNPTAFLARVATLLPTLPPSPMRSLIAALLVNADATALFDQVARIYFLEGLFNLPASGRKPLRQLSQNPKAEGLPPELFDPRTNTGLYKVFLATVKRAIHNPQQMEEAAQNIFAGITPGKGSATDPIFYAVGKAIRQRGGEGDVTVSSIKNAVVKFTLGKARDYGKLKRSPTEGAVGFDSPLGEDTGRTIADILADETDYTMLQTVFDTPAGAKVLRRLSETITAALPSEGQKAIWNVIVQNPSLIGSSSESVAGADLADILASQGYEISRQRAGQLWRKVLETVRQVAINNPKILADLEDQQLVKRMLDPRNLGKTAAKRLARRYASLRLKKADDAETDWAAFLRAKNVMDKTYKQEREQIEEQEQKSGTYTRLVNMLRQAEAGDTLRVTYNDPQRGGEVTTVRIVESSWNELRDRNPGAFQRPTVFLAPKVKGRLKSGMIRDYGNGSVLWQPTMQAQVVPVLDIKKN
jgi:hypothetical protein